MKQNLNEFQVTQRMEKGVMPMGIKNKGNRRENDNEQMDAAVVMKNDLIYNQGKTEQNTVRAVKNTVPRIELKKSRGLGKTEDSEQQDKENIFEKMSKTYQESIIEKIKGYVFDSEQKAIDLAREVYRIVDSFYFIEEETPILKIAESFGFTVFKVPDMPDKLSGRIKVYSQTQPIFKSDKVILINARDSWEHQRFVIAHELAHYLMQFIAEGRRKKDSVLLFTEDYQKNIDSVDSRSDLKERCADSFAAELLMPRDKFIDQYCDLMLDDQLNPSQNRMLTVEGLSQQFKTRQSSIERRIKEVLS